MISIQDRVSYFFSALGSLTTEPICRAHEAFIRMHLKQQIPYNIVRLCFYGVLSPLAILGIGFRGLGKALMPYSFYYQQGKAKELPFKRSFQLFSFNTSFIGGGYPLITGEMAPWRERIHKIVDKILLESPSVVALMEVYDFQAARSLIGLMSSHYAHFYYHMGPRALGAPSGLFIASKHKIADANFTPFSAAIGNAKHIQKGFFKGVVGDRHLYVTHLQHSNDDFSVLPAERKVRGEQAEQILRDVSHHKVVLTGDLNMGKEEFIKTFSKFFFNRILWKNLFTYVRRDRYSRSDIYDEKGALLDHTSILYRRPSTNRRIFFPLRCHTKLIDMVKERLSDHQALLSVIA